MKRKTKRTPKTPYFITKVKAINVLSNISHKRLKGNDAFNVSFITDCFSIIIQDFNTFFLERKFYVVEDRELINMLWEQCIPKELHAFILLDKSFKTLSNIDNTFENSNDS